MDEIDLESSKITVYVHSVKKAAGAEQWGEWGYTISPGLRGGYRLIPDYKTYAEITYENVLPEDQEKFVEMVKEVASRFGFDVEIVDAARCKRVKVKRFPTIVADSGNRIEGIVPQEQIESFLSKVKVTPPRKKI